MSMSTRSFLSRGVAVEGDRGELRGIPLLFAAICNRYLPERFYALLEAVAYLALSLRTLFL